MNTKQLRQKILDLAIRGKLVPQDLDAWKTVKLGDIAVAIDPQPSHRTPPICENGIPYVGISECDYETKTIDFNKARKVGYNVLDEHINRYKLNQGDFIIGKIGTIGKPFFVPPKQDYALSANIVLIQPNQKLVDAKFLFHQMGSISIENQFMKESRATTQSAFGIQKVRNLDILFPPLAEQQRIVAAIESAFAVIDEIERKKADLQSAVVMAKQKILSLAIQGKLVPQDPEDEPAGVLLKSVNAESKNGSFDLPESWAWCKFGDVCDIARGGSPRPIQDFITNDENGVNWIKIGDTEQGGKYITNANEKIRPEGISRSRFVYAGNFLLTNSMSFGRPYILKIDGCIHDGWLVIGKVENVFAQDYLYYLLSSNWAYQSLSMVAYGSTVKNLKSDTVKAVLLPLPPLAEQKRIVAAIEAAFEQLDGIAEELK